MSPSPRRALALLIALAGLGAAPAAQAATLTATNLFAPPTEAWRYQVAMGNEVSTLTFEAVPGDPTRFRVTEAGASLVFNPPSGAQGPSPCSVDPAGGWRCKVGGTQVTNSGGSAAPPVRDQVIVRGSAHGDAAATWSPEIVSITSTGGLMEFWSGEGGGGFSGSDVAVGSPAEPADIWHAGPNGGCISPCDLRAGSDRLEGAAGAERVNGGAGADVLLGAGGNDALTGGGGDDVIGTGSGKDTASGGDGTDTLSFDDPSRPAGISATFAANVAGTFGQTPFDDSATPQFDPGTGDAFDATFERYEGTPLADRLTGGPGADGLGGAGGDDVLIGGGAADRLDGGPGSDTVDYSARPAERPVNVALAAGSGGNAADDGAGDALVGIENVVGGAGDDVLTGDDGPNRLESGPGADVLRGAGGDDLLVGGPAVDAFFGDDGADSFSARDGLAETVDCGPGSATLDVDDIDVQRGCPVPAQPATPARTPDVAPGPATPQAPQAPRLPRVSVKVALATGTPKNGRTLVRSLKVTGLRVGDVVGLRCSGTGCRRSASPRPSTLRKGTSLSLTKAVQGLRLRAGAVLSVTVTRAGSIGQVVTFVAAAKRKAPVRTTRCLAPGATAPEAC